MTTGGKVVVSTELDNSGINTGMNGLEKSLKKIGGLIAVAFGTKVLLDFGRRAIDLGSSVSEVQNVVDVSFGSMAYKCEEFAQTAITQFGMSRLAAKQTASTYMAMAKSMGLSMEAASDMAINVAKLSGDVASFYNVSQELAALKLKGIFTGETEALKDLGVVMTEENLKQYALAQGITRSYSSMSQAEKVALRYNFVMSALSDSQGDFAAQNFREVKAQAVDAVHNFIDATNKEVYKPLCKPDQAIHKTLESFCDWLNDVGV